MDIIDLFLMNGKIKNQYYLNIHFFFNNID